jgi:hypothetical protein
MKKPKQQLAGSVIEMAVMGVCGNGPEKALVIAQGFTKKAIAAAKKEDIALIQLSEPEQLDLLGRLGEAAQNVWFGGGPPKICLHPQCYQSTKSGSPVKADYVMCFNGLRVRMPGVGTMEDLYFSYCSSHYLQIEKELLADLNWVNQFKKT